MKIDRTQISGLAVVSDRQPDHFPRSAAGQHGKRRKMRKGRMTYSKLLATTLLLYATAFSATKSVASDAVSVAKPVVLQRHSVSMNDRDQIRSVVEKQIIALRNLDSISAFSLASPSARARFKTPMRFLSILSVAFRPMVFARLYLLDGIEFEATIVQRVVITGPRNREWMARFLMERQADGTWRVNGCKLSRAAGQRV